MAAFKQNVTAMILMALLMMASLRTEAVVTCSLVVRSLNPCMTYLKGAGGAVPAFPCCNGIRSLNSAAQTTPDRQAACKCLKSAADSISGLKNDLAAALPSACGVSIPYQISPSTDCATVN